MNGVGVCGLGGSSDAVHARPEVANMAAALASSNGPMKGEQEFPFGPISELSSLSPGAHGGGTPRATMTSSSLATHLTPPPAIVTSQHSSNNHSNHCYNNNNHNRQRDGQRNRSSESSTSPSASSLTHADDDVTRGGSLVDESFMRHYNVKELQTSTSSSLVDEEFLRHYRVDEIAASMGYASPYSGNYGYDYFMGGKMLFHYLIL